ncbi:MAG: ABC transporter substrate-binding protein [Candidatus Omnitrophica bacterium]|nr:ABC transporter substrate-binding protein [Candidatus Omnitrophota bacterium]
MKSKMWVSALVFGVLFSLFCTSVFAQVKIGAIMDKTGKTADVSLPMAWGIEDYYKYLNAQGGINSKKIDLIMEDERYDVNVAREAYLKLRNEGVIAILGWGTGPSKALLPQVNVDKICWFSASMDEGLVNPVRAYNFIPGPTYTQQFNALLQYAATHPKGKETKVKVAFIYNSSPFGVSALEAGTAKAAALGIEVAAKEIVELNATDATEQINRIKAVNPDYIIIQETGAPTIKVINDCAKAGLKTTIMGTFYSGDESVIKDTREALKSGIELIVTSVYSRWYDNNIPGMEEIKKFAAEHRPELKEIPVTYIQGWIMAKIYAEAIKKAGTNITKETFQQALESLTDFNTGGLMYTVNFSATDHIAANGVKILKADPETGHFTPLTDWIKIE